MEFKVNEGQMKRFNEWSANHEDVYTGAIGARYMWSFIVTSIGTVITVTDTLTKGILDLSDYDSW